MSDSVAEKMNSQKPLYLRVLGGFEVERDGEALRFSYDKMRALFTYLVFEQHSSHRREYLAQLLWPDHPQDVGRANLRTALSRLNSLLGQGDTPLCLTQVNRLRFNPALPLQSDAHQLLETPTEVTDSARANRTEQALRLYTGPFLAGLELPGCEEFNGWVLDWRARLRNHALLLARTALSFHRQRGRSEAALPFAERWVAIDPLDETGQRELMRLLADLGQSSAIKERFELLRRHLQDHSGLEPEAETVKLVQELCGSAPSGDEGSEFRYLSALYAHYSVAESADLEYQAALLETLGEELASLAGERGGHIVRTHAGGLLAYFGSPLVREDDARQAVSTALAMAHHARSSEAVVTIGVHSALTLADPWSPDRGDRVTSTAMRLAALARDNQPLVSDGTAALLQDGFELEAEGEGRYRVTAERERSSITAVASQAAPFIGRDSELSALHSAWREVQAGSARVLLVRGEPGAGKSRLLEAFNASLDGRPTRFSLRCLSRDEGRPYHPLTDLLQRLSGLDADDTPPVCREKLRPLCAGHTRAGARRLALFARLLCDQESEETLVPAGLGQQLLRAVSTLVRHTARQGPMVIAIEDLHWADPSTLALLHGFISRHPRLLLLLTARPEFDTNQLAPLDGCITLPRLADAPARALVQALTDHALPAPLLDSIVTRAEGVPLFIEELARSVRDTPEAKTGLTLRLGGLLLARLDRLGPAKRLAQCAAVLGREFHLTQLRGLYANSETMDAPLQQLLDEKVLVRMADSEQLRFHHALYQDAAYSTLIGTEREALHFRAAKLLTTTGDTLSSQQPERIAWHYARARAPVDAAGWWLKAGRRALYQGALVEAETHLRHGLEQVSQLPPALHPAALERELQVLRGTVLFMLEGYGSPAAAACFDRAHQLLETKTSQEKVFAVRWGEWLGSSTRGGHIAGRNKARQLVTLAQRSGHAGLQALAWWALGNNQLWLGEQGQAADSLQKASAFYQQPGGNQPPIDTIDDAGVMAQAFLAWNGWLRGDEALSHRALQATLEQAGNRPGPLGYALAFAAFLERMKGDAAAALPLAERLLQHGRDYHFALWEASGQAIRGWAMAVGEGRAEGIGEIEAAIDLVAQVMPSIAMTYHSMLAEACGVRDKPSAQLEVIDRALSISERYQDNFLLAELHRFRGDALKRRGESVAAREAYRQALTTAERQGALPFLHRARAALEG
ncbi:MAG: AAA family ATPase [Pseudomonadota bacterium]